MATDLSGDITHLYISEPNEVDFTLSLENVTYFNPLSSFSSLRFVIQNFFSNLETKKSNYVFNCLKTHARQYSKSSFISVNRDGQIHIKAIFSGQNQSFSSSFLYFLS